VSDVSKEFKRLLPFNYLDVSSMIMCMTRGLVTVILNAIPTKRQMNTRFNFIKIPFAFTLKNVFIALFSFAPVLTWWLAEWPAVMTNDSLLTWSQVKSGNYEQFHTVSYTVFVWFFSFGGHQLSLVALIQSCLLFYSVYRILLFCNSRISKDLALLCTACLYWLPYLGGMGNTLWKDVPFTSITMIGLIQVFSLHLKPLKERIVPIGILSLGLSFRHDGILFGGFIAVALLCGGVLLLIYKNMRYHDFFSRSKIVLLATAGSIILAQGLNLATSATPSDPFFQKIPLIGDIAYVSQTHPDKTPESVKRDVLQIASGDAWAAARQCSNLAGLLFSAGFSEEGANNYSKQALSDLNLLLNAGLWRELLNAHICRAMSFIPPPLSAGPSYSYWTATGIAQTEYNQYNLVSNPPFPKLSIFIENWRLQWEKYSALIAWPGFLFLLSVVLVFLNHLISRGDSSKLFYLIIILGSRLFGLVFFTVAQDFRYALVVHLVFLALFVSTIVNLARIAINSKIKRQTLGVRGNK
jgi:hypothetical protein